MAIITAAGLATAGKWALSNADKIAGVIGSMGLFGGDSGASARAAAELQYKNNLKLQKQAQKWNEKMYKNRYQWQVDDLEAAGINKLYGLGTAPAITSATNSVGMPDMVGEKKAQMEQKLGLLNFGADLSAKIAQGKLLQAQARTEEYNTQIKALEVYTQQLTNLQKKKDLDWTDRKNIAELNESISRTKKNLAELDHIGLITAPLRRYEDWISKNKGLGNVLERTDRTSVSARILGNLLKSVPTGIRYWLQPK